MADLNAAYDYVQRRLQAGADARDIIRGLVDHHAAKQSWPSYRTALRIGGIYCEAATCCDLWTAKLLLRQFLEKASSQCPMDDLFGIHERSQMPVITEAKDHD